MTSKINFDSFDLQTRREIKEAIECEGLYRVRGVSPIECYSCGRTVISEEDHSEYCMREGDE